MKMNKNTSLSSEVEKLTKERNLLVKLLEESNLKLEEKTRGFSLITRIGDIIENSFDIDSTRFVEISPILSSRKQMLKIAPCY
jgi:hypothetical protein